MARGAKPAECGVDVVEMPDQIAGHDEVVGGSVGQVQRLGISDGECQARIFRASAGDGLGRNIDAQAPLRIRRQCREQVAGPTAELEHATPRGNEPLAEGFDRPVVIRVPRFPLVATGREGVESRREQVVSAGRSFRLGLSHARRVGVGHVGLEHLAARP
jgi:hypothetical protein